MREQAADDGDRLAVRQPGRPKEDPSAVLGYRSHCAAGDIDDDHPRPVQEIVETRASRRDREMRAVGAPGHLIDPRGQIMEATGRARLRIDEPDLARAIRRETPAVLLEVEPIGKAIVAGRRCPGLRLAERPPSAHVCLAGRATGR